MSLIPDQVGDRLPAAAPDVESKALRVKWVVGEEHQLFAFHGAAAPAIDAPDLELQVDARVAAGEIAHPPRTPVVPAPVHATAAAADRFFERRMRVITRTCGLPNTPRTVASGRNPAKAYTSVSRRCIFVGFAIANRCQIPQPCDMQESRYPQGVLLC